jgi:hypothetical protein
MDNDPFSSTYQHEEEKPKESDLPPIFVKHAADVLGDTQRGFSGSQIVELTTAYAVEHDVKIPHQTYPFDAPNKRKALYDNLVPFPSKLRYVIIRDLCRHRTMQRINKDAADKLMLKLVTRYSHLDDQGQTSDINPTLIEETRHWLTPFPSVLELYVSALQKHDSKLFVRNLLDDLRLALEKLAQELLGNQKTLENQVQPLGKRVKEYGGSSEFSNMFLKLIEYYTKYQNTYVKHDDAVVEAEVEFLFEITSSFMKHLVRLHQRRDGLA